MGAGEPQRFRSKGGEQARIFQESDIMRFIRDARGTKGDADVLRGITANIDIVQESPQKALKTVWGALGEQKQAIVRGFTDYLSEVAAAGETARRYGLTYDKFVKATQDQPGRAQTVLGQAAPRRFSTAVAVNPYQTAIGGGE